MHDGHVLGAGIDLVENARMAEALAKWGNRFKNRVFLPSEQQYCDASARPESRYAARFAVKEAVAKALSTGIGRHLAWRDVTVLRNSQSGAPAAQLSARAQVIARRLGVVRIHISLSHTQQHAVAMALVMGPCPGSGRLV